MGMPYKRKIEWIRSASRSEAAAWLLLLVPGLIWGASFLFIAEGLRVIKPSGVTFLRILIGFATLSVFPAARRRVPRSDWAPIAVLGVLWMAFPLSMFPFAEKHVSSALTGMLNGANPLFTAMVASVIAHRLPSRRIAISLAVGMTGAVLMALPSARDGSSSAAGIGMIVAALISYGFALNLATPLYQRNGALPVIWRAQMAALLLTAPLGVPDLASIRWIPGPWTALLALGVLGTGVAYVVLSVAAGRLGATRASATTFLIPPVALVLGIVVRGERVALLSVLGSAVCVAGAWIMRRPGKSSGVSATVHAPTAEQTLNGSGSDAPVSAGEL
jgi:drug/metabolite transporter (DMT)-like permease